MNGEWKDGKTDQDERAGMIRLGLLPNPDGVCMAAEWGGLPSDPTRLEQTYEAVLHQFTRELERTEQSYQASVREGYQLREELSRLAQALHIVRDQYDLRDLHVEMLDYLLRAEG